MINMAENNLRFLNARLFARKGEAIPAVLPADGDDGTAWVAADSPIDAGVKKAAAAVGASKRSPLSFLIQRRSRTADDGAAVPAMAEKKRGLVPQSKALAADMSGVLLESVRETLKEFEAARTGREPRRQLTVRLSQEDFRRVKSLAGVWGTTYQSLLEKGVRSYVLSVAAAERACAGVKGGAKATATPPMPVRNVQRLSGKGAKV